MSNQTAQFIASGVGGLLTALVYAIPPILMLTYSDWDASNVMAYWVAIAALLEAKNIYRNRRAS